MQIFTSFPDEPLKQQTGKSFTYGLYDPFKNGGPVFFLTASNFPNSDGLNASPPPPPPPQKKKIQQAPGSNFRKVGKSLSWTTVFKNYHLGRPSI